MVRERIKVNSRRELNNSIMGLIREYCPIHLNVWEDGGRLEVTLTRLSGYVNKFPKQYPCLVTIDLSKINDHEIIITNVEE